ncbi:MAG: hypothetical protein IJZ33_07355 [Clostridia bacterium]|nr:hypothetical protein [Clostridia bacterium]
MKKRTEGRQPCTRALAVKKRLWQARSGFLSAKTAGVIAIATREKRKREIVKTKGMKNNGYFQAA